MAFPRTRLRLRLLLPVLSVLSILSLLATAQQPNPRCANLRKHQRRNANNALFHRLRGKIRRRPVLAAVFLRAAFHDCITAQPTKPGSGCNGSLRLELNDRNNRRLRPFVHALNNVRREVRNGFCISVADGIQIGMAAALRHVGGPDVKNLVWDNARPRADANEPDDVKELPEGGFTFSQTVAFYRRKGFSVEDAVVSNVGGHALGGFRPRSGGRVLPFVPGTTFSTLYAENLVNRSVTKGGNAPGFNTLPSDSAFISNEQGRAILRKLSGSGAKGAGTVTFDRTKGLQALSAKFKKFLIRQSRLTDRTVGNRAALG